MWQPGRWQKVCQQYDVFSQSWGFMQSTAEGSRDHRQMGSQKGNSDVIFTNSSQCARRITLPVCTTEVSGDWSLVWSIILEERRRRGEKKKSRQYITRKYSIKNQGTATSKAESWQVIKPRAHPLLENCGLLWHWKGKIELERVQRRGIPKAETHSPGSFGREKDSWRKRKQTLSQL